MGIAVLTHYYTIPTFNTLKKKKAFQNIVGKGENGGNQHCLLFPEFFLLFFRGFSIFEAIFFSLSANALNFEKSEILSFGKESDIKNAKCKGDE